MAPRLEACQHCGTRVVTPATQLSELMETAEGMLPGGGAPFHLLQGSIFVLVGVLFTATLIGAIVGIPAILVGLGSWRRAWRAWARR